MFGKAVIKYQQVNEEQRHQRTFSLIFQETIDLGYSAIEHHDRELVVGDVHDQVLTHDGQTDEAKITTGCDPRRSADIDAGETGATVSP